MPKVLIVSEEDPTPDLARTVLWGPDVERLVASSTTAAFEIAPVFLPSLVVLQTDDKVTALGLLKRLREAPGTRRSSLVVLTRTPALSEQEIEGAGGHLVLRLPLDAAGGDGLLKKLLAAPRRVRTRFPVRLAPRAGTSADQPVLGLVLDASVGGMLVEAAIAPRLGETLDLSFTLPGNRDELCATAEVVRLSGAQSLARLGLRFLTLAGEVRERIQDLMDAVTPTLLFGRYEAVGPLGEGSMGRVYRGFDPMARRVVAIKTLRPELLKGAEGEEYLRRFQTEAQAAARLVHPNIITIFDVGHDYFVMELLEGQTLQTVMRQRSRLWPDELRRFLGPVAEALDYAHGQGTIHRDVKPSNIMVLLDSRPKLMDFGIAHLMSEVIKASEQLCGSPAYMAPEQITGGTVTPATDLFSLAAVAYEALTGRRPFEAKSIGGVLYRVAYDEPTPPTLLNSALPATSDEVFRRALAKEPEARFASATEFLAALDPGGGAMQAPALARPPSRVTARLTSDPAETIDLKKRNRLVLRRWSAAISILCGLGLGGAWLGTLSRPKPPPAPPGLQVSTSPAGATVRVDGREAGRTPLFLTGLSGGAHSIRVVHKEYAPAELTVVTASEGPPMPLRFTLWPVAVGLQVESDPPAATVDVDGRPSGTTPLSSLRVLPGPHTILVRRSGFRTWTRSLEAVPGDSIRLMARLEPDRAAPPTIDILPVKRILQRGDRVELGPGVTPPRKVAGRTAPYPKAAGKLRQRGSVTVEFEVTETGGVVDPRVLESAGEILDEAVLRAVRQWEYEPARAGGVEVRVRIQTRQTFESGRS